MTWKGIEREVAAALNLNDPYRVPPAESAVIGMVRRAQAYAIRIAALHASVGALNNETPEQVHARLERFAEMAERGEVPAL